MDIDKKIESLLREERKVQQRQRDSKEKGENNLYLYSKGAAPRLERMALQREQSELRRKFLNSWIGRKF